MKIPFGLCKPGFHSNGKTWFRQRAPDTPKSCILGYSHVLIHEIRGSQRSVQCVMLHHLGGWKMTLKCGCCSPKWSSSELC